MTASQEKALAELWPDYGIEFTESPLDLDGIFGRSVDKVLEIGFGNGETLVQAASAHPELDYVGIEVHEPGVGHCLIRARESGVGNLRVIAHDALDVLRHQVAAGSLARINLLFPDPWPKKRHHKRRIVQPAFLSLAATALRPGGELFIATDWENYADHIDETMAACAAFTLAERRDHEGDQPLDREMTKFEARGLRKGHRIRDWRYVRQ